MYLQIDMYSQLEVDIQSRDLLVWTVTIVSLQATACSNELTAEPRYVLERSVQPSD